jgi:hypothetical protein
VLIERASSPSALKAERRRISRNRRCRIDRARRLTPQVDEFTAVDEAPARDARRPKAQHASPSDPAPEAARALLAAKPRANALGLADARCSASNGCDFPDQSLHGLASVEGQSVGRMLGDRVGPGQHAAGVVDVQVLDQGPSTIFNTSRVLGYRHSDERLLEKLAPRAGLEPATP